MAFINFNLQLLHAYMRIFVNFLIDLNTQFSAVYSQNYYFSRYRPAQRVVIKSLTTVPLKTL